MRNVVVIGVGSTNYDKQPSRSVVNLGSEAVTKALADAGLDQKKLQIAYASSVFGNAVLGQRILADVGVEGIEVYNVENACAGGATAFRGVWQAIASGFYDIGLAVGVESMTTSPIAGKLIPPEPGDLSGMVGNNMPAHFALSMKRHMALYETTLEQFAQVSVKNHHNGCLNPLAQYKEELTVDQILGSKLICDPITLLQCCPNSDGAAAAVLCSEEMAEQLDTKGILVAASVLKMGGFEYKWKELANSAMTEVCAREAYAMAGCSPSDIDVCELHDAFAYCEVAHYEELGFCKYGEGGKFIEDGKADIGGVTAVNPSGGLLAKGHPVSATGIAQIVEIVWQLRGDAGERQHPGAKIGLAHTAGGEVAGLESGACAVHIFKTA